MNADKLAEAFSALGVEERSKFLALARALNDSADSSGLPVAVRAYDDHCEVCLKPFLAVCVKLGSDCEAVSALVEKMWAEQRQVIMTATKCREPDQAGIMEIFAGVGSLMREIGSSVKRNTMENNIKTIFEGAQACNWMLVKPAPVDFMTSYIDGADMWSNRVRKEFKGVNEDHIAFCVLFKALMIGLRDYVKEFHRTGLAWNPKGMPLTEFFGSSLSSPVSSTVPALVKAAVVEADPAARVGMFAALNAGGAVTSGLKKVTKDQQTWRAEYKGEAPQPAAASKPKVAAASTVATGPPKFELKADKWVVDNQVESGGMLTVNITDIKQTVYLYKCDGVSVTVVGKCKSIIIDSCRRVTLVFADLVASLELVNSRNSKVTCTVKLPSVAIDKCDGVLVTLPISSLDVEVVASKSSEMNLSWPDPDSSAGDMLERPIPEQYVHTIAGRHVTARVSDLYTH